MIWRTILKLTNPSALHSDWHNCFNQVLPDMCKALEADELFLLDNSPPAGTPLSMHDKVRAIHTAMIGFSLSLAG